MTGDRHGFLPFDAVAPQLAAALDARTLAARRIGELRHRESPGVPGGYLSNGCIECDALIGRFHLEDLLHEHLIGGGTYPQLDIGVPVELPLGVPARRTAARLSRPGERPRAHPASPVPFGVRTVPFGDPAFRRACGSWFRAQRCRADRPAFSRMTVPVAGAFWISASLWNNDVHPGAR